MLHNTEDTHTHTHTHTLLSDKDGCATENRRGKRKLQVIVGRVKSGMIV